VEETGRIIQFKSTVPEDPVQSEQIFNEKAVSESKDENDHPTRVLRYSDYELNEDDEEEEEDNTSPFLKDLFFDISPFSYNDPYMEMVLEVIKYKGHNIIDVQFLTPPEKYTIDHEQGRFCLATYKNPGTYKFFFHQNFSGLIRSNKTHDEIALQDLKTPQNLYKRRKGIYAYALPKGVEVYLKDGDFGYLLRQVPKTHSPQVVVPAKSKKPLYKNLVQSAAFHLVMMILLGILVSPSKVPEAPEPEGRFVKIEAAQLKEAVPIKPLESTPEKPAAKPSVKPTVAKETKKAPSVPLAKKQSEKK